MSKQFFFFTFLESEIVVDSEESDQEPEDKNVVRFYKNISKIYAKNVEDKAKTGQAVVKEKAEALLFQ